MDLRQALINSTSHLSNFDMIYKKAGKTVQTLRIAKNAFLASVTEFTSSFEDVDRHIEKA
jgi:hypothetical protein